ncbi:unnamed protein product [Adineta ricciae]|uniref:Uncharacterized protein n=1 Tax=Adineta ricciae TaxID=249248 RepID=A0A815ST98_ADIRI|nr:unnamed protein product [Adineta ricciae]CAF1494499.1 unnamed protein product [Adineta ricciae]
MAGLGLFNLEKEKAKHLFTNETNLTDLFRNQITSLTIHIRRIKKEPTTTKEITIIFTDIFTMFTNLKYLNFKPFSNFTQYLSFETLSPIINCPTIVELHVNVKSFFDCLYLLDGRLPQLRVFHVDISWFGHSQHEIVNNMENLPNLECFSLNCNQDSSAYDELVIPLLHRMLNLKRLHLYLVINYKNMFIDGDNLKTNILNRMVQLNQFTFSIRSSLWLTNQTKFISNEDIQHTFEYFSTNQIISYVDYFHKLGRGECHIYSYPYKENEYHRITNNFPGGIFKYVREISLFDERPFEHEFFFQISQSFPLIEKLTVNNEKVQNNKSDNLSIIEYPRLSYLDLLEVHEDYVKQFLIDTNSCLPNNVALIVDYEILKKATENFTRQTTRNCSKLCRLAILCEYEVTDDLSQYFPQAKITYSYEYFK